MIDFIGDIITICFGAYLLRKMIGEKALKGMRVFFEKQIGEDDEN